MNIINKIKIDIFIIPILIIAIAFFLNSNDYNISHDYLEYSSWYDLLNYGNYYSQFGYELGYNYLGLFFKQTLNFSYKEFILTIILISLALKYISEYTLNYKYLAFSIYALVLFTRLEGAVIREALCLGCFVFSYSKVKSWGIKILLPSLVLLPLLHSLGYLLAITLVLNKSIDSYRLNWLSIIKVIVTIAFVKLMIYSYDGLLPRNAFYLYGQENYFDKFALPRIGLMLLLTLVPIGRCTSLYYYRNLTFLFTALGLVFSDVNYVQNRFLDVGYFFSLIWIFSHDGKNKTIILLIFSILTFYEILRNFL